MIENPLLLAALIGGVTALSFWLDRRYRWAATVGATLLVIVFGALLSNFGLVTAESPVYGIITGPVTSLAIVWLLFAVDLRDLKAAGPRMLGAFGIAVGATAVGAIIATFVFAGAFGDDAWKLAGVLTGTYAGGSLNFVAVGRELDFPATLFSATTAADNVVTALWMGASLTLPLVLGKFFLRPVPTVETAAGGHAAGPAPAATAEPGPSAAARSAPTAAPGPVELIDQSDDRPGDGRAFDGGAVDVLDAPRDAGGQADHGRALDGPAVAVGDSPSEADDQPENADHPFFGPASLRLFDVSVLFALGFLLLWAAEAIAATVPGIPSILWLTTLALAIGQLPAIQRLSGAMQLGTFALHLFFVVIGIGSRIAEIASVGPEVFYLTASVVLIHGLLTYGVARAVRLDVGTTAVASQAAVGGPSTALALAVARDWRALVLPGTVAGLLGYAAGNYVGLGVAYLMRGLLGG